MILNDLLSSDAFTPVNKKLAKEMGFIVAGYFGELIRQRKRFGSDEFFFSQSDMTEEIGLSEHEQRVSLKKLVEAGFVKVEKKGMPSRYFFRINDAQVLKYFNQQSSKISSTSGSKFQAHNKNNNKNDIILYNTNVLNNTEQRSEYGNQEINEMQSLIKKTVENIGLGYKAGGKERQRIRNILTGKDYGELCAKVGMTRSEFLIRIFQLSTKIKFWHGKIYNAETFYNHYIKIYNDAANVAQTKTTTII